MSFVVSFVVLKFVAGVEFVGPVGVAAVEIVGFAESLRTYFDLIESVVGADRTLFQCYIPKAATVAVAAAAAVQILVAAVVDCDIAVIVVDVQFLFLQRRLQSSFQPL